MNNEFQRTLLWGPICFEQVEHRNNEIVRYENHFGTIKLWLEKSKQWLAQFDNSTYSVERSWDEALLSAAKKAIASHQYSIAKIEASIEYEYGVWELDN